MQTFKQFLEAREIRDIPHDYIMQIITHINNPILCIRFALYCVEDCFHLNNEITRPLAQRCIDLVKKWLRNPKSVTEQELRSAADAAWTAYATEAANNASRAASYAVNAIVNYIVYGSDNINYFIDCAAAYAVDAIADRHQYSVPEWRQIRNQKRQEYIRKLKGMTTARSGPQTSIEPLKGYDNDYVTIMAALDNLEEIGEIGKEHFVYQDDDGQWVFDLGHDNILRAASKEALAKEIHKDKYYLAALMRLYNATV